MSGRRRLLARRVDLPGVVRGRARPGSRVGRHAGLGSEILASRVYVPGDDVKRVDWKATARTATLHVKSTVADVSRAVTLVIDTSSSMRTGSFRRKIDVAADAAGFIAEVAAVGGERSRLVSTGRPSLLLPAGAKGALAVGTLVGVPDWGADGTLTDLLGAGSARYTVIFTDVFVGSEDLAAVAARARGGLLVIEISDPNELSLPAVGRVRLSDPETGRIVVVDTGGPDAERYRSAIAARRATHRGLVQAAGGTLIELSTTEEVDAALAARLPRRR